ncbi:MAG: acyl-CoA dehydrogenase family protein [bacterium]
MKTHDDARADLAAWRAARPTSFYDADPFFQRVLRHHLGPARLAEEAPGLSAFGAECAGLLDALVCETNRDENLPVLRRFDGIGRRTEEVVFHPAYDVIGERVYRTGVMSRYAQRGQETIQLAYAWLFSQNGEGGHLCPLACTAGLIKILQRRAPAEVRDRFLPGLLRTDRGHPEHFHAAQFLTEIQGGSDVGANACTATPAGDGTWRINGEKWFCSVIDADLYLMTARPDGAPAGTPGLGAFVVPRRLPDGSPNGIFVRRLKYKLGTRSMASGEADFQDAVAWPIAAEGGFKAVVEIVLNTSRLYNAIASTGSMQRVLHEACAYAAHRRAFGQPIGRFPLVARTLARIEAHTHGGVAGTFALAALADRLDVGQGSEADEALFRLVVNMNKYWTSVRSSGVIHDGIEILGGNGAIEDFSVLPRLYRDAIVCESWEGTHNVLCAQVLKDLHRYRLHTAFFAHADARLAAAPAGPELRALAARVAVDRQRVGRLLDLPPEEAAWEVRGVVDRLSVTWQALALLDLSHEDPIPPALPWLLDDAREF